MNTRSKFQKIVLSVLAFAVLASLAMTYPAQAKSAGPDTGKSNPVPVCKTNCIRVTELTLTKDQTTTDPGTVMAVVTIRRNADSKRVSGVADAHVYALWTLPDGSQMKDYGLTDRYGQVVFQMQNAEGEFTFTIVGVEKKSFNFDQYNSILTQAVK